MIGEAVNGPDGYFASNLDALYDALWGGMGQPDDGRCTFVWTDCETSRSALGYPETVRQLEQRLQRRHPSNVAHVKDDLQLAPGGTRPNSLRLADGGVPGQPGGRHPPMTPGATAGSGHELGGHPLPPSWSTGRTGSQGSSCRVSGPASRQMAASGPPWSGSVHTPLTPIIPRTTRKVTSVHTVTVSALARSGASDRPTLEATSI